MLREFALACALSTENAALVRETLSGWSEIEMHVLALPAANAQVIILFDRR
jgi:hypothetical protein